MDYKNFLLRSFFSFIFVSVYFIIVFINFYLVFYLILIIFFLIFLEIILYFNKYKFIPLLYLIIALTFFLFIDFYKINILKFNLLILIIISFDIFSYVTGKLFGKRKLINISPNKTIEGFFGGLIISSITSIVFAYYYDILINIELFIFIILIIFSAFIGDIIESYFKRKNDLKNSSNLIPGHGGVFDRFDSFLFSIIIYSISIGLQL